MVAPTESSHLGRRATLLFGNIELESSPNPAGLSPPSLSHIRVSSFLTVSLWCVCLYRSSLSWWSPRSTFPEISSWESSPNPAAPSTTSSPTSRSSSTNSRRSRHFQPASIASLRLWNDSNRAHNLNETHNRQTLTISNHVLSVFDSHQRIRGTLFIFGRPQSSLFVCGTTRIVRFHRNKALTLAHARTVLYK